MPVKVTFGRPRGEPIILGPFERLMFVGIELRDATRVVAVHTDHSWRVNGDRYSRLDIPGPVLVVLGKEDRQRTFGPFTAFSCVDGVAYSEGHVFAFVDNEQRDWYCVADGHHWKTLEMRPKSA